MGQVEAEVDRGFAYFLLQVAGLLKDARNQRNQCFLQLFRWHISKEYWQCLLNQLQNQDVVFQNRVIKPILTVSEEGLEGQFHREVLPVDLTEHGISSRGVQVMQLFDDFLNSGLASRPGLRERTGHDFLAEELHLRISFS